MISPQRGYTFSITQMFYTESLFKQTWTQLNSADYWSNLVLQTLTDIYNSENLFDGVVVSICLLYFPF